MVLTPTSFLALLNVLLRENPDPGISYDQISAPPVSSAPSLG